jgi:DNA-binding response OmpR family regulator
MACEPRAHGQRVLIVDDDSSIRTLVRRVLVREAMEVDEAANGEEAVGYLRNKHYDAILLDLMMGPGNGFDVLNALKELRPGEKLVIVMSAASQAMIDEAGRENVGATLRKPFDIDALVSAVRDCTGWRSEAAGGA